MSKRRSKVHPNMDLVRLRGAVADEDIPSVEDYMLPVDSGE